MSITNLKNSVDDDDLRDEYDLTQLQGGVRGKYVHRYRTGTNLVRLEPDVAAAFSTEAAVNAALRLLMEAGKKAIEQAA